MSLWIHRWFCLLLAAPVAQFALFVHGWAVAEAYTSAGLGWAVAMAHVSPLRYLLMVWFVALTAVQVWPLGAHSRQWASLHVSNRPLHITFRGGHYFHACRFARGSSQPPRSLLTAKHYYC